MGPTNTNARYRPPPPGMAPPPPPPPSEDPGMMGGYHQQQQPPQQQQQSQSYYSQQPEQPQPSYYAQQPPQKPPPPPPPQQQHQQPTPGGYAARSAAAHSPQRPTTTNNNYSQPGSSQHSSTTNLSNAAANAADTAATTTSPLPNNNNGGTISPVRTKKRYEETPFQVAEQSRLLTNSLQRLTESSYSMQHSMEMNDVVTTLEQACLLLEELGDPNHGVKHSRGHQQTHQHQPPSYYSTAGGAVPPLGNYNDRYYPGQSQQQQPGGGGGDMNGGGGSHNNNNGTIALLSPKNYYELHMRAMDEMPILEEFLLGLCHSMDTPSSGIGGSGGGPTNAISHMQTNSALSTPYTCNQLYETVQYCPRVVPRLYLQICMGSVSIRTGNSKAVDVMAELSDAAKCVQCPVRGLFLRYYLLMALKDKLPDGKDGLEEEDNKEEEKEETEVTTEEVVDDNVTSPTLPPPSLPPPPPPMEEDSLLFSPSGEDNPLFSDSPLDEPQQQVNVPQTTKTDASAPKPTDAGATTTDATSSNNNNTPVLGKGTVVDSYEFILQNLLEMNRLWIRIQHMPGDKTKETKRRRERERNDLRILVGSNLNRLSQLEGISAQTYGSTILPRILQEVASCRDPLAQAYLMDCIIQVFPDEFHLETLEVFLGVLPKLRDKVNTRTILTNMMERLLHYYQDETLVDGELDTNDVKKAMAVNSFDMFEDCVQRVFEARGLNIPPRDVIRLQGCLLNYALKISPGNIDLISRCIGMCAGALGALKEQKKASMMGQGIVVGGGTKKSSDIDMEAVATGALESLLSVPLEQLALQVLDLPDYSTLMSFLPWENRKVVALSMIKSVVAGGDGAKVKDIAQLERLLEILAPLLRDKGATGPAVYEPTADDGGSLISRTANLMGTLGISPSGETDMFEGAVPKAESFGGDSQKVNQFQEEQTLVAKLVHVLDHEDTDVAYQMLNIVRKHITPGGPKRAGMTLPPIIFAALMLLRRVQALEFPPPVASKKEEESELASEPDTKDDEAAEESTDAVTSEDKEEESAEDQADEKDGEGNGAEVAEGSVEEEPTIDATEEEPAAAPLFAAFNKTVNCRKILVFLQKTVAILAPINPELAFKLYLEIAAATDLLSSSVKTSSESSSTEFSSIAYDFLTQAFLVYEDEITDSAAQVRAITSIVGTLLSCRTFEKTDYEALITKTAQYSAKLLKKPDQCRMVCLCSRLFYAGGKDAVNSYHNPQRVLECLQRGLKIADACSRQSSSNIQLFVEILDYYVYYYEVGNPAITDKFVSGLIALVNEHLQSVGVTSSTAIAETKAHYAQIVDLVKKKKIEKETAERFGLIVC